MLWVSLCRLPDTLSPEHKMHDQKVKHLQTEEKVFDSPLLCNCFTAPPYDHSTTGWKGPLESVAQPAAPRVTVATTRPGQKWL